LFKFVPQSCSANTTILEGPGGARRVVNYGDTGEAEGGRVAVETAVGLLERDKDDLNNIVY
jgi:hypothetical protein